MGGEITRERLAETLHRLDYQRPDTTGRHAFELADALLALLAPALDAARREERERLKHEEHGWLIERRHEETGGIAKWWDGLGPNTWTTNAAKAVRFARRSDAEAVIELARGHEFTTGMVGAFATEHTWSDIRALRALAPTDGRAG